MEHKLYSSLFYAYSWMGHVLRGSWRKDAARAWSTVKLPRPTKKFYAQDRPRIPKSIPIGSKLDISVFQDTRISGAVLVSRKPGDAPPELKVVATYVSPRKRGILKFKLPRKLGNGTLWIVAIHVTKQPRH